MLVGIRNLVFRHPGAALGLTIGAFIGFVLGASMVRYGFPPWVLPVQTIVWAIVMAPVVKGYLDKLK